MNKIQTFPSMRSCALPAPYHSTGQFLPVRPQGHRAARGIGRNMILSLFVLLLAVPARAGTRIDPFLRELYHAVNTLSPFNAPSVLSPALLNGPAGSSTQGVAMVDVLLKTTSPGAMKQFITSHNGSTGVSINGILTARIPLSLVPVLAEKQNLVQIVLSRKLHPLLDKSVPAVSGDLVHSGDNGALPRPYTGENVIIGIVDSGLDLTQTDMLYPDGSTKVIALWDQTTGQECTGYQINTGECKEKDTEGHGTHVTGIANSGNSIYTGMAPDAMLVIVKTDMTEADVLTAINYIFSLASQYNLPAVINISLGAQIGPHDDSTAMEQALDAFVTESTTPRAIVVAAGNDGANAIHLGMNTSPGGLYVSSFSVVTNDISPGSSIIDLWYKTAAPALSFALGVIDMSGNVLTSTSFVAPGSQLPAASLSNVNNGTPYGTATIDATNTLSGGTNENEVVLELSNGGSSSIDLTNSIGNYRYALFVNNTGPSSQSMNAWLTNENSLFDTMTSIAVPGYSTIMGDTSDTVSFPATAQYAIAVGSFATKTWSTVCGGYEYDFTDPYGTLSFFSSLGPTPDPAATGQKPNITAPGEVIVSSLSSDAALPCPYATMIAGDKKHVALAGTSMATPHVTGAIALLYDRNNGLDITGTINALETSATPEGTVPNDDWGYGKLNALNLVLSVSPTPTPTTGPSISAVNTASTSTSGAKISWSTDRLSTSHVLYWKTATPGQTVSTGTTTMTAAHMVDVSGLNSNTPYSYQVISADPYGNTSVYPTAGALTFTTQKPKSSGCMCEQSGGAFNAGDLLPSLLLLLGWLVMLRLLGKKGNALS